MNEQPEQSIEEPVQPGVTSDQEPEQDRRELLKKVRKFAAYTPPALIGLYVAAPNGPLPSLPSS